MEGKRREMLFLLLVTLSSVMGQDFTFSKEAYNAILARERQLGVSLTDAGPIELLNMDHDELLVAASNKQIGQTDMAEGIYLAMKDPKAVKAGISRAKKQNQEPERLYYTSIVFTKIPLRTGETVFGNFVICFEEFRESPTETCMRAFMFSPPKTQEDKKYAKQNAEELNPFSQTQVKSIAKQEPFKWALSSLNKILLSDIKKYVNTPKKGQTVFGLKTIIVNENLLNQYFDLANPTGEVGEIV